MAKSTNGGSWIINIPNQGINTGTTNKQGIIDFLNAEISYYGRLGFNNSHIMLANQNYGSVNLTAKAQAELNAIIQEVQNDKTSRLEAYVRAANNRLVLVGSSAMGKRVEDLKDQSPPAAVIMACILSWDWIGIGGHTVARDILQTFRAIAFANPANVGFDNLVDADAAVRRSREALAIAKKEQKSIEEYISEKTELFERLENLYRKQLTIQEPAISWEKIAAHKAKVWRTWLFIFSLMVVAPIITSIVEWEKVSSAVSKLTANAGGAFSITGLAVISIPSLFYAWLLKNISRVFIQNLNLADDADHRRSLSLTYMGLLQDEKRPTSDADRAIILNALFRPLPSQTTDEGPPAGLIELIKK